MVIEFHAKRGCRGDPLMLFEDAFCPSTAAISPLGLGAQPSGAGSVDRWQRWS
jgi:hypothetical protein